MDLNEQQLKMCEDSSWDFSDLKALFLNCTLKRSPERSSRACAGRWTECSGVT